MGADLVKGQIVYDTSQVFRHADIENPLNSHKYETFCYM